ncbi:MAG: hypothetical protein KF729_08395 [Sandaracinaceae bacterium]|nr:hypothetical protein [Sandaracinaceae bacterium]
MRWYEDPKLARTLGRVSWVVLVGGFVVGTRFRASDPIAGWALVGALVVAIAIMSFPTALGLYHTRRESHTRAHRLVAFSLLARLAATVWVTWQLLPRGAIS